MEILLIVIFTLLGIAVGSFLNVVIDRLPAGRSLLFPPSQCDACGHRLSPGDNIPVFGYLWLRGRCRYCGARIPQRIFWVELLGGILFFLAFWRFGLSAEFAITAFWCCVFLVIIFIDWEHRLILNKITYPAAVAALVILAVDFFWPGWGLLANLKLSWPETGILSVSILNGIIGGAIGFAFFFIVYFLVYLIRRGGLGEGDIKLAGLIGLVTGVPLVIVALFVGIFIGGIVGVSLLLFRIKGRKDFIPYGTFLAIGPIAALLWESEMLKILSWYLGFF